MAETKREFGTYNEWGQLKEVFVGIEHDYIEPEWMSAFAWMGDEGQDYCRKYGGQKSIDVLPDKIRILREQIENKTSEVIGLRV